MLAGVDVVGDYQRPAEGFFGRTHLRAAGEILVPFMGMVKGAQAVNRARGAMSAMVDPAPPKRLYWRVCQREW